jgi:hypothetical protein
MKMMMMISILKIKDGVDDDSIDDEEEENSN